MKKAISGLFWAIFAAGCTGGQAENIPLSEHHPAYDFYQTANSFYVAARSCTKLDGSLDIRPEHVGEKGKFEKRAELAPGLFVLRDKETGGERVAVYFLEYSITATIPKICAWDTERFPVESPRNNESND